MATRDEGEGRWRAESGAGPASGGHLPPDQAGPLLDPVAGSAERGRPLLPEDREAAPTEAVRRSRGAAPSSRGARRQAARRRAGLRRVKRVVKHVDPFSVLKLSLFFYACLLLVWLLFVAIVYSMISSAGVFETVSSFCRSVVVESCSKPLTLGVVERWALVGGVAFAILGSLANMLMAIVYNVAADLLGGLELIFVERDA